jgi:hypothetical protein
MTNHDLNDSDRDLVAVMIAAAIQVCLLGGGTWLALEFLRWLSPA